jgi:tRNA(Ile)-lysidine synthase
VTLPSLATLARRVLDDARVPNGATILTACSGGLDSQVLLDVLAHVGKRGRLRVVACSVDHGLRPAAKDELALVAALAHGRGVEHRTVEVAVKPGSNLQARAREARWNALREVAAEVGATRVATAHHREDRAETVLIRILRGAPLEGLAVLAPESHDVLRPLIHASRSRIESHARDRRITWADDPSNADPRFLRTRVRREVLPLLRTLDPRIDEHLVALADGAIALACRPRSGTGSRQGATLDALAKSTGSSARAIAALRGAAAREGNKKTGANVLLPGGRSASWDQEGEIVITPKARWHGR